VRMGREREEIIEYEKPETPGEEPLEAFFTL
jgi:hypothetical protein